MMDQRLVEMTLAHVVVVKSIKIVVEEINKLNIIKGVYPRIKWRHFFLY